MFKLIFATDESNWPVAAPRVTRGYALAVNLCVLAVLRQARGHHFSEQEDR